MFKVEVKSTVITPRSGTVTTGPRTGQQFQVNEQEAWIYLFGPDGNPHPYPLRLVLDIDVQKGQQPYPVGVYQVSPTCFYVNRFNKLDVGRLVITPVTASTRQAA